MLNTKKITWIAGLALLTTMPSLALNSQIELNIEIEGSGTVVILDTENACDGNCSVMMNEGQVHTLQHQAADNYDFVAWGENSCDSGKGVRFDTKLSTIMTTASSPKTVEFADFNGDGANDMALLTLFSSKLRVAFNDGTGQFVDQTFVDSLTYSGALDSVDWDGDGDIDLVVSDYGASAVYLYLNNGNGQFEDKHALNLSGAHVYSLAIGDIDQDSLPDLVVSSFEADINASNLANLVRSINDTDLSWYRNEGKLTFSHFKTISKDQGIITLDVADAEQDGDLDIIAAAITSDSAILYRGTDSGYDSETVLNSSSVYGVAFGDLDSDGLEDIAAVSYYAGQLHMMLQATDGEYASPQMLHEFSSGPTAIGISDIDMDGRADIGGGVFGDRQFYWLRNTSFEDCVIATDSSRTVLAKFLKNENAAQPAPAPVVEEEKSSGGSTGFWFITFTLLVRFRRRFS